MDAPAPTPRPSPPRRPRPGRGHAPAGQRWAAWLRGALLAAYAAVLVTVVYVRGFPLERAQVLAWIMGALLIATAGRPGGGLWRIVRDWVPLGAVLAAYDLSRGLADTMGMPVQIRSLARAEELLFGGTVPTVWLQQRLGPFEGGARWWEVPMTIAYLSHFVAAFALLAVLWVRNRGQFRAFRRRFLTLTATGLATYMLVPAAPPWMASEQGLIGPVQRVGLRGMDVLGLGLGRSVIRYGAQFGNPVAALPSLHAGWSAAIALYLASRSPRWAWPLLAVYPLWMGFALVVAGEHYVVDVLLGYAYAGLVALGWVWWERRRAAPVLDLRVGAVTPVVAAVAATAPAEPAVSMTSSAAGETTSRR